MGGTPAFRDEMRCPREELVAFRDEMRCPREEPDRKTLLDFWGWYYSSVSSSLSGGMRGTIVLPDPGSLADSSSSTTSFAFGS